MKRVYYILFLVFMNYTGTTQTILPPDSLLSYTPLGFPYLLHTKQAGTQPQPGQIVRFRAQMRSGDMIYYTMPYQDGDASIIDIPEIETDIAWRSPALQLLSQMVEGDSGTTFLRIDTLSTKPRNLENTDWLAMDIRCIEILDTTVWAARKQQLLAGQRKIGIMMDSVITAYKRKATREQMDLQSTRSRLRYLMVREGSGVSPFPGRQVRVHYAAYLRSGQLIDSSLERNEPFTFTLGNGEVIDGWDEGVQLLREGSEAIFFIPARLAYGERGAPPLVPPHAEIIYYIKLIKAL